MWHLPHVGQDGILHQKDFAGLQTICTSNFAASPNPAAQDAFLTAMDVTAVHLRSAVPPRSDDEQCSSTTAPS